MESRSVLHNSGGLEEYLYYPSLIAAVLSTQLVGIYLTTRILVSHTPELQLYRGDAIQRGQEQEGGN